MSEEPPFTRNRKGCFVILAILVLFVALYMFVGFSAGPGNKPAQQIQTVPAPVRS